jgi:hypothetical protein
LAVAGIVRRGMGGGFVYPGDRMHRSIIHSELSYTSYGTQSKDVALTADRRKGWRLKPVASGRKDADGTLVLGLVEKPD